jgi:gamma-glutamyltranspeptidase / glutathione hydrolase
VLGDLGGVMTLEDLASHTSTPTEPVSYTYNHTPASFPGAPFTLHEHAPNGQGLTALIALGILDQMQVIGKIKNLSDIEQNSVEWLHALM